MGRSRTRKLFGWSALAGLAPGLALAAAADPSDCALKAERFGDLESVRSLSSVCVDLIFASSNSAQSAHSEKGDVSGWKNVIAVRPAKDPDRYDFIAGPNPDLRNVRSVAADEASERIWVLDEREDGQLRLKAFSAKFGGNLLPTRTYQFPKTAKYSIVQFSKSKNEIALYDPESKRVDILSAVLPPQQDLQDLRSRPVRTLSLPAEARVDVSAMVWSDADDSIYLLDSDAGTVLVLRASSGEVRPPIALEPAGKIANLRFSARRRAVEAVRKDGSVTTISRSPAAGRD